LQTTQWAYDAYGRVTNKFDQAGNAIFKYAYDADGRIVSRWTPARGYTYYTNDAVGNLVAIDYPVSPRVTFSYDALNRVTTMVDASGTNTYSYTTGGRLWTESSPFASATVTNGYLSGKRLSLALQQPSGAWTNGFAYDAGGRLTNLVSQAGAFGYVYFASSASSLPFGLALPNSSYITNTYDSVARLTGTYLVTSGGTVLDSAAYEYNWVGQRTNFANQAGTTVAYEYDNIGQLVEANSSAPSLTRGYAYDAAWNLNWLTNSIGSEHFQVDGRNQLTNWPTGPCAYDADGNLTNKTFATGGRVLSYAYDDEDRLTQVADNVSHTFRSTFVYDGIGRLRARAEYSWVTNTSGDARTGGFGPPSGGGGGGGGGSGSWQLATNIWYIYDGRRVIQERNSGNTPLVAYTRGNDLKQSLEGAGGIGGLLARSVGYSGGSWTSHAYYHADGNGNITYLETSAQGLGASYEYDPYGNLYTYSGSLALGNVYRFSSKECRVNSGMYYYLYRFYDPELQRWINRDPIQEAGGVNLYSLLLNSPVSYLELFGLAWDGLLPTLPFPFSPPVFTDPGDPPGTGLTIGQFPVIPPLTLGLPPQTAPALPLADPPNWSPPSSWPNPNVPNPPTGLWPPDFPVKWPPVITVNLPGWTGIPPLRIKIDPQPKLPLHKSKCLIQFNLGNEIPWPANYFPHSPASGPFARDPWR